jgi:hypothetical protein
MVLDFDGGQVSPEAFEEVFWLKAKKGTKCSFVLCNSFSRSPEKPNKFRVLMFYKQPAVLIEEHQAVFDWIERRLEEAGYPKEMSGLDRNGRSGVLSFYLPCTNRMHPDWAFFRQWGTKTKELRRCALDPEAIAASAPRKEASWQEGRRRAYSFEAIEEDIRRLYGMTDGRRGPFFEIGRKYACNGLSRAEVEHALRKVAGSDARLLDKIPDVIKSLMAYGWLK